jgi:hypothetical protein
MRFETLIQKTTYRAYRFSGKCQPLKRLLLFTSLISASIKLIGLYPPPEKLESNRESRVLQIHPRSSDRTDTEITP